MKEYLENYFAYKARIKVLEIELRKQEDNEVKISGSNFELNGDIRPTGYMTNNIENQIINKSDKIIEIEKELEELRDIVELVDLALQILNYKERKVVDMYIMKKMDRNMVASALGYSEVNSITRISTAAIKKIERNLKMIEK